MISYMKKIVLITKVKLFSVQYIKLESDDGLDVES
jgi:hypothetical protein